MVGYDTEDKAYCMELTFNYGLKSYPPGSGLKEFGVFVPNVADAVKAATTLGYQDDNGVIVGPDEYRFRPLAMPEGRTERFSYVLCRSGDIEKSVAFYKNFLGFSDAEVPAIPGLSSKTAAVSYTSASHPHSFEPVSLVFYEDGVKPTINPWEGRHAFALEADEVNRIYAKFKAECPDRIMHDNNGEPISLQEKLGTLFIFIAKDPDGYELCLVSRETMLPATVEAVMNYDEKLLDFEARDRRIAAIKVAGSEVEELIKTNPVVIFSKAWCPFCVKTKAAFEAIGAKVLVKELEDESRSPLVSEPSAFQEYIAAKTNKGKSVPKVFIKGEFIGGGDDTLAMWKSGQLLTKCVAAGASEASVVNASETNLHYFVNGVNKSKVEHDGKEL